MLNRKEQANSLAFAPEIKSDLHKSVFHPNSGLTILPLFRCRFTSTRLLGFLCRVLHPKDKTSFLNPALTSTVNRNLHNKPRVAFAGRLDRSPGKVLVRGKSPKENWVGVIPGTCLRVKVYLVSLRPDQVVHS